MTRGALQWAATALYRQQQHMHMLEEPAVAGRSIAAASRSMLMVPSLSSAGAPNLAPRGGDGQASARQRRACPTLRHDGLQGTVRAGLGGLVGWFDLGEVEWVGVAVATLAAFVVGFLWYHPRVFGAAWARLLDVELDDLRGGIAAKAVTAVVALAVTSVVMCVLMAELLVTSISAGLVFGAVVALVFRLLWGVFHGAYDYRPLPLTLLDAAHDVVALAVIGAVLGAFL
jgi:hypothetical protein